MKKTLNNNLTPDQMYYLISEEAQKLPKRMKSSLLYMYNKSLKLTKGQLYAEPKRNYS